jgi:hypothetical protein
MIALKSDFAVQACKEFSPEFVFVGKYVLWEHHIQADTNTPPEW